MAYVFSFLKNIYLFESQTETERHRDLLSAGSLPKLSQQTGQGWASRSQEARPPSSEAEEPSSIGPFPTTFQAH